MASRALPRCPLPCRLRGTRLQGTGHRVEETLSSGAGPSWRGLGLSRVEPRCRDPGCFPLWPHPWGPWPSPHHAPPPPRPPPELPFPLCHWKSFSVYVGSSECVQRLGH